jgi:hypothetical protein
MIDDLCGDRRSLHFLAQHLKILRGGGSGEPQGDEE